MNTSTTDPYLLVRNLAELQQQAGVERETAELVVAYAALCADRGRSLDFYGEGSEGKTHFRTDLLASNAHLDPRSEKFLRAYAQAMHTRQLPAFFSKAHLAGRLGVTPRQLHWLAHGSSRYRTFYIPKASGQPRRVDEPVPKLKSVQRWILTRILEKLTPHKAAHGFRFNRSIITNARGHTRKQVVVRIDIQDFFPSIVISRVTKVFLKAGYPFSVAHCLSRICTRDGVVPIGSPTSPALANLICRRLDNRLSRIGKDCRYHYTRYADDLVFSSWNRRAPMLIPFLKQVIQSEGFVVNEKKLSITRRHQRQQVTGIVVNRTPNVRQTECKWLRAVVHNCLKNGVDVEFERWKAKMGDMGAIQPSTLDDFCAQLGGRIGFVRQVNSVCGEKLWKEFQQIDFA